MLLNYLWIQHYLIKVYSKFLQFHNLIAIIPGLFQDIDPNTVDLGGLRWSPDASKVAVWDLVYPGKLKIFAINGSEIAEIEVFGIHDIQWSPTAQLIAAASAGSKVNFQ